MQTPRAGAEWKETSFALFLSLSGRVPLCDFSGFYHTMLSCRGRILEDTRIYSQWSQIEVTRVGGCLGGSVLKHLTSAQLQGPGMEPRLRLPARQGVCFSLSSSPVLVFPLSLSTTISCKCLPCLLFSALSTVFLVDFMNRTKLKQK